MRLSGASPDSQEAALLCENNSDTAAARAAAMLLRAAKSGARPPIALPHPARLGLRPVCCAVRWPVSVAARRGFASMDASGKPNSGTGMGTWLRRGATAFFVVSGIALWGTVLVEWVALESLPAEIDALLKAEEKEEEKVSRFYGLEHMSKDIEVHDEEYFAAIDERKILLQALITKLDGHPQMEAMLGKKREVTYLANREADKTASVDWLGSNRAERERGEAAAWLPRFHIQGEQNHQHAIAEAKFVDNQRTGELTAVSLKVECLSASATVLDVAGPPPHGLKYIRFD